MMPLSNYTFRIIYCWFIIEVKKEIVVIDINRIKNPVFSLNLVTKNNTLKLVFLGRGGGQVSMYYIFISAIKKIFIRYQMKNFFLF